MAASQAHERNGPKKGPWAPEEDEKLTRYMERYGKSRPWREVPNIAGLNRSRSSCISRWTNYLRPDIKRGNFSPDEENIIIRLHSVHGNR